MSQSKIIDKGMPKKNETPKPKKDILIRGHRTTLDGIELPHKKTGAPRKKHLTGSVKITDPYKFTPEIGRKIADDVRLGATYETAATANYVTLQTLQNWINSGLSGNSPELSEFAANVEAARSQFVTNGLRRLHNRAESEGPSSWLISCWLLERCTPGQPFAIQRQRAEVQDVTVQQIQLKINSVETAAIESKSAQLELTDQTEGEIIEVEELKR
jgi:hypothetical protein